MDFQKELNDIFETIKDTLPTGVEYLSYNIKSYTGRGTSGQSYFAIVDGKPDREAIPEVLKSDRETRNNEINKRINDIEFEITVAQQPGRFVIFSLSKENGFTYRIATLEELVYLTKFYLMGIVDPGTRKEIFADVAPDKKTGKPDVIGRQKIYYGNGEVKEYTGAPISDFARAAFHALDEKLKFVYAMVSPDEAIIRTSPAIPGLTELYEVNEDLALDASKLENIYEFLESHSEAKVGKALEALQANSEFRAKAEKRYGQFIKARVSENAGIDSFAEAALTRKEVELFGDRHFTDEVISLSRLDEQECQTIVTFIGSLVQNYFDIKEFKDQMESAENKNEAKAIYLEAAEKVKNGILDEAHVYEEGWFGKILQMLAHHEVEKLMFEKTRFKVKNDDFLKGFIFYLGMNNSSPVYFDVFQSTVSGFSEFFWFLPSVPRTAWGDTDFALPENTLKFSRRAHYRIGDEGEWQLQPAQDDDRPAILVFYLSEFFERYGMSVYNFSKTVSDSPFFIYDRSLKKKGPKFPDEVDINKQDFDAGFNILKTIWTEYVAHADTPNFSRIFKTTTNLETDDFFVESTYGFAPGYNLDSAVATITDQGFAVVRWEEFWDYDVE
ncbi:hypothetical protein [Flavobacterium sp.]|uniref:hypothetical protein n=1 Tax=Flavobacterium sp. TaxID=239 RepID=UPI001210A023|nr:hypothetical protein [Flavobacterium sp.]RZJ71834.1 MAG: hypothetical protein EOO49_09215 [Flavobacterium sp.]